MAGYPYYDGIEGRMKGEQKDIENVKSRLDFLSALSMEESDDGEITWIKEIDNGENITVDITEHEAEFLELWNLFNELHIGRYTDYTLEIDKNYTISLETIGDGFNEEEPWKQIGRAHV